MQQLRGLLKYKSDDTAADDFSALSVALVFTVESMGERRLVERRFPVRSDGAYHIALSENADADERARLSVLAPSGETLAGVSLADLREEGERLRTLAVARPDIDFRPSEIQRSAARTVRLNGRLMVVDGGAAAAADQPLSLEVQGATGPMHRIWSGTADRNGYFRATLENRRYRAARALVGSDGGRQEIDIVLTRERRLPQPLIIVVDSLAASSENCHCETVPPARPEAEELALQGESFSEDLGTSCQSMTTPNRTLEEFDFFRIARTTDPSIKGTTLPGGKAPQVERADLHKIVFDAGTLSEATGASALAARQTLDSEANRSLAVAARRHSAPERAMLQLSRATRGLEPRVDGTRAAARAAAVAQPDRVARAPAMTGTVGTPAAVDFPQTLAAQISVDPLSASGVGTAALWREASQEDSALAALDAAIAKIPPTALAEALSDPDGFTPDKVMTLERRAGAEALRAYLGARAQPLSGRGAMNEDNPVDWDHTPEFYQATSVAHGHILHFKQEWQADGYSLGDVVQSIPLAPGQQKQIVTLDWDREDRASREESTLATETLEADLSRDRDINEIASAAFRENLTGSSSARTGAVGGGLGLAIGPLVIGGGGGSGWASSEASQDAARSFSADSMNALHDQTSQAAAAVRNQRATIVQTNEQSERVGALTEVISNFNRCHALTIQYFEVLRHFAVHERLARVSECLFVPLEMSLFDDAKVLRWREILERACRDRALRRGFDAIERLSSPATTPPDLRYADDPIEEMSGRLRLRVSIARPKDPDEASRAVLEQTEWRFLGLTLKISPETIYEQYSRNAASKERIFRTEIAPKVAREFLASLEVVLIDLDGQEHPADFDLTVTSRYQENGVMEVVLNDNATGDRLPRGDIAGIEIRTVYALPEFSKVILEEARIVYRTERLRHRLVSRRRINDDVLAGDPAYVSTAGLSWLEERNKLAEDRQRRRRLLRHLNDNIEHYHRVIWLGMDANRRYLLLDGFEAPNAAGRSIASVVENRLIGVVGNSLVMPLAPGFQLDPVLREVLSDEDDAEEVLNALYAVPPAPPRRHSIPTRGVFGEAMPGSCKSCELIEEDRFWRWSDYPLPDSPPAIAPLSTDSRYADPGALAPTPFPDALVKYQAIPDAPDPSGMSAALGILTQDIFKDLSGLSLNQKNALGSLVASMGSAEAFAGEAMSLALARDADASLDRTLGQVETAHSAGYLDDAQASKAARDALLRAFGGSNSPTTKPLASSPEVAEAIDQAASSSGGSATITRENGEDSETIAFETTAPDLTIGAAPTIEWIEYPLWVNLPLILDGIKRAGSGPIEHHVPDPLPTIDEAREAKNFGAYVDSSGRFASTDAFGEPPTDATLVPFDYIQSALDAGLLKPHEDDEHLPEGSRRFLIKIEARLCYPADASSVSTPKAALLPHDGKGALPLVVILHGQGRGWIPTGPVRPPAGVSQRATGAISSYPNHEGYRYLQEHMATLPEPLVSLSINTNVANVVESLVEMRAEMLRAAIVALKDKIDADATPFPSGAIDFDRVGLLGHSRGGEAVVRAHQIDAEAQADQPELSTGTCRTRAICSLAPTDITGITANAKVAVNAPSTSNEPWTSFLVVWGGLDGDVGKRKAGMSDQIGSGQRIYDRSTSHKAFVFAPSCTHNRFNNPHWPDETEWWKLDTAGSPTLDVPPDAATEAEHETLAKEFIGGFFDLVLNDNAALQPLFRGETKSTSGLSVVQQWAFGSKTLVIDNFESPTAANSGTRTLGAGMSIEVLTPIVPRASRDPHCTHRTRACILDIAAAGASRSILRYDLSLAGSGMDLSAYHYLTLRLGQLYDVSSQAAIDALPPPDFLIRMTDGLGNVGELDAAWVYAGMPNPLGKPRFKEVERREPRHNVTQTVMHTFAVDPATLSSTPTNPSFYVNLSDTTTLELDFATDAGVGEVWIDSIQFISK